jgi:hypothetical protein
MEKQKNIMKVLAREWNALCPLSFGTTIPTSYTQVDLIHLKFISYGYMGVIRFIR